MTSDCIADKTVSDPAGGKLKHFSFIAWFSNITLSLCVRVSLIIVGVCSDLFNFRNHQ